MRRWYTSERHGSTGKGTEYHCNLKSGIVKRMTNQPNHTSVIRTNVSEVWPALLR